jgi:hypothetical protein
MRGFTSLLLTMLFLVIAVSGVMLFLTPRGRVANWTGWTLLGLDKDQWGALHIMVGILFVIIAGLHLYLNWSVFLSYLKKKSIAGMNMKRELAVATVVAILLLVGAITGVPPFSSIMALNDDIKDYWEEWAAQAPVPHAEELTLVEFSGQINLSLGELKEALQDEGFTVDNSELTVGEVGRQKGVSPIDVLTAIQKHYPDAGASRSGRGFGGGRGQGFGRGRGGGECDEDDSSSGRGSRTASTHQRRSGNVEEVHGMGWGGGQGRGQGQGLGQGQGRGQGQGLGQGQGRGQGQGLGQGEGQGMGRGRDAGSGFGGRSSNADPSADETSKHSTSEGSGKLKGRTIVEKGKSITIEGH